MEAHQLHVKLPYTAALPTSSSNRIETLNAHRFHVKLFYSAGTEAHKGQPLPLCRNSNFHCTLPLHTSIAVQ